MSCDCGAKKTYNAKPGDNTHSGWCSDSAENLKKVDRWGDELDWSEVRLAGQIPLGLPPLAHPQCNYGCGPAVYSIAYPMSPANIYSGQTINWCGKCCTPYVAKFTAQIPGYTVNVL